MNQAQPERSHFWVFTEAQLEAALADWLADDPEQSRAHAERASVRNFLHAQPCIDRAMRRGGDDE